MSSVKTMASWPRLIKSFEEIPALFQNSSIAKELKDKEFPYMIFIPPFRSGFRKYNPMIIYMHEQSLYIIEKDKKKIETCMFSLEDINFIETGIILLNSWVKIGGVVSGEPVHKKFEFNTVTMDLINPIVRTIRRKTSASIEDVDNQAEKEKFNFLSHIKYKFMTYGRQTLLADSRVLKMTVQPEITIEKVRMFGKTLSKTICASHLCVLTDKELIILNDIQQRYSRYGVISNYIELSKICSISIDNDSENGNLEVHLNFKSGDYLVLIFSNELKGEVSMFTEAVMAQKALRLQQSTIAG